MSEAPAMETKNPSKIPDQLNYRQVDFAGSKYRFAKTVPIIGSQSVKLDYTSASQETLFDIPSTVMNLAESYLTATINLPAFVLTDGNVQHYPFAYMDGMPLIQEISLSTRSGVDLCRIPNFQHYMKTVRKLFTDEKEYLGNSASSFLYPPNNENFSVSITNNYAEAKTIAEITTVPVLSFVDNRIVSATQGEANHHLENVYLQSSSNTAEGLNIHLELPLSAIKKSIFALNKNIVLPDILVLRILWSPCSKVGFLSRSATAISTPINYGSSAGTYLPALSANTISLTNIALMLAVERNEDLASVTRKLVNSPEGLDLLVDFPWSYTVGNLTADAGLSHNLSYRINRNHGKNLLGVVTSFFPTNPTAGAVYDNSNVDMSTRLTNHQYASSLGRRISYYYTQLDNVRLQDYNVLCGGRYAEDFRENKKHMKDTPIYGERVYNNNWFHFDKMYEDSKDRHEPEDCTDKGLSLIVERKYDVAIACANTDARTYYNAVLCQRVLHIGANSISWQ